MVAKQNKQLNFFRPVKITRINSSNSGSKLNFSKHKLNVSPSVNLFSNLKSVEHSNYNEKYFQSKKFKISAPKYSLKLNSKPVKQIKQGYIKFGRKPVIVNTKENIRGIPKKELTYAQAKLRYPKLKSFADNDGDGKLNMFDCKPFDKKRHGFTVKNGRLYASIGLKNKFEDKSEKENYESDNDKLIDDMEKLKPQILTFISKNDGCQDENGCQEIVNENGCQEIVNEPIKLQGIVGVHVGDEDEIDEDEILRAIYDKVKEMQQKESGKEEKTEEFTKEERAD